MEAPIKPYMSTFIGPCLVGSQKNYLSAWIKESFKYRNIKHPLESKGKHKRVLPFFPQGWWQWLGVADTLYSFPLPAVCTSSIQVVCSVKSKTLAPWTWWKSSKLDTELVQKTAFQSLMRAGNRSKEKALSCHQSNKVPQYVSDMQAFSSYLKIRYSVHNSENIMYWDLTNFTICLITSLFKITLIQQKEIFIILLD